MKRIYAIIVMILVVTFTLGTIFAGAAVAQTIKWRLVSCWPSYSSISQSEKNLARTIYELSGGRLQITTHPAGELVSTMAVFDTVSKGAAEMGADYPGYWAGKNSAFDLLGSAPMALSQHDFVNWYIYAGGRELYNYMYGKYNMVYFVTAVTAVASGIRSRTPVRSLADLKGKKIRISGKSTGYVMQKAGATPVMTEPAQIAQALATGAIDAAAFNTPNIDISIGLAEVTKYNLAPGWHQPFSTGGLLINKDAWNSLPPDLKKIVEVAATANILVMSSLAEWDMAVGLKKFQEKGTVVTKFSAKDLNQIEEWLWEFIEAEAKKNPDYDKIATSMFQYLKNFREAREYMIPYAQGRNPVKFPKLPNLK
ncbi:MAG TPA: TRAP transporter substrate-binding protein DctP [Smithellaceae bacterium]|nr:TRAP transporter substrate-binding protein DctP [Smithellaceae bacterium]HOS09491.1 TRAP transporter substrate-binding protein DctP [Smithellaceae bacterium]HPD49524.1 TRAP transporter substrate-binding protein DctP [Smithellaceae bacterium]HPL50211.1 TRAP transporter substrate-binding protein DctP [Smithellaceae bacterium]HPY35488.1 TRAP transporter substrate-binding protein DctP [Smithellaceae bacterium]